MSLATYKKKRDFKKTKEPEGSSKSIDDSLIFVIQKHAATRLHYDLRLELNGVLKSWAVPKGPSLNPADKRLAIMVEDHPFDYKDFEGVIPKGNYGAGEVIIWDAGVYMPLNGTTSKKENEKIVNKELDRGDLKILLAGKKLEGAFGLVRMKGEDNTWLLLKKKDEYSGTTDILEKSKSIISNKKIEDLKLSPKKKAPIEKSNKKSNNGFDDLPKSPMPLNVKPMLATLSDKPFNNKNWIFEIKFDGYRMISTVKNNKVEIYSRNLNYYTEQFPQIKKELGKINKDVVLDGEIVAVDSEGNPSFQLMQNYQNTRDGNILYYIFDLLWCEGHDYEKLPLLKRKEVLREVLPKSKFLIYSEHVEEEGMELFDLVSKKGLEGLIAKKADSLYYENSRTKEWLKIKTEMRQEAIICGFTAPRGGRKYFGSLILGVHENKELIYIGHTGTGFNHELLKDLYNKVSKYVTDKSPFDKVPKSNAPVTWLKPKFVCEIKFSNWTGEGILRHPVYMGIKEDKSPEEVVRES